MIDKFAEAASIALSLMQIYHPIGINSFDLFMSFEYLQHFVWYLGSKSPTDRRIPINDVTACKLYILHNLVDDGLISVWHEADDVSICHGAYADLCVYDKTSERVL